MATIHVNTEEVFKDVFGEDITILDVKNPLIEDVTKEKVNGEYPKKHNVIKGTFLKIVVFSLVETVRKQTESGAVKTNVKTLEDSIKIGKIAEKIVIANTSEGKLVDIVCGGSEDEQTLIQECVHNYYENVEIDYYLNKIFNN